MRILVVEDEEYSRRSLVKQIHQLDTTGTFKVIEASNGKQGLEMFQCEQAELVLTDIRMPHMSGLELLKHIAQSNPQAKVVMVSGYAEFNYAREAIKYGAAGYLLKPVKDSALQEVLGQFLRHNEKKQEQLLIREEDVVSRYIYRQLKTAPEPDYIGRNVFTKIFPGWRLLCFYFVDDEPDREAFYKSVKDLLPESYGGSFRIFRIARQQWGIVLREEINVEFFARDIVQCIPNHYIGISPVHTDAEILPEAYRQAQTALKSKLMDKGRYFYYNEATSLPVSYSFYKDQMDVLHVCLEKGDSEKACRQVNIILNKAASHDKASVVLFESILLRIKSLIHEMAVQQDSGRDMPDISLIQYHCREDLEEAIYALIRRVCAEKEKLQIEGKGKDVVERILRYTEEHYSKNFSLKYLAENVFFINHAYLSHLISEQTGVGYTAYLQQVRVKKAKELLMNKQLTITEIATLTGYNDASHFIQVFKKHTGVTPNRYRKNFLDHERQDQ